MAGRQQRHTGPFRVAPVGGGISIFLSFVTDPRVATVETAGLAVGGAVVVIATMGPGGMAIASTGETAGVGPAIAGAEVTSAGAGEARSGSMLAPHSALGADVGSGEASRPGTMLTASKAPTTFCSSLSLLEATREALLATHTFQAHGEAGPTVRQGASDVW